MDQIVVEERRPSRITVDNMIHNYVRLRAKKKEIEERHKQELAPYNDNMEQIAGWLLEALNQARLDSMRGEHGTAYKSLRTSAVVRDWSAFLAFVRQHDAYDLLEKRVSKLSAFDVIQETGAPIPGVETSAEWVCNVRKAGEQPASGK